MCTPLHRHGCAECRAEKAMVLATGARQLTIAPAAYSAGDDLGQGALRACGGGTTTEGHGGATRWAAVPSPCRCTRLWRTAGAAEPRPSACSAPRMRSTRATSSSTKLIACVINAARRRSDLSIAVLPDAGPVAEGGEAPSWRRRVDPAIRGGSTMPDSGRGGAALVGSGGSGGLRLGGDMGAGSPRLASSTAGPSVGAMCEAGMASGCVAGGSGTSSSSGGVDSGAAGGCSSRPEEASAAAGHGAACSGCAAALQSGWSRGNAAGVGDVGAEGGTRGQRAERRAGVERLSGEAATPM